MGILNATPDSFSDGGRFIEPGLAIEAGQAMIDDGAAILDVGGESTRPGATAVPPDEEQRRILPIIAALARSGVRISVDTRNASTMARALDAGAGIVNDVSALAHDPEAAGVVAARRCPVILMHMRGTPATMQSLAHYADVAAEVRSELQIRIGCAVDAGIAPGAIAIDPGFGFAKRSGQSRALLQDLSVLSDLGFPIVAGVSRKSFIGSIAAKRRASDRDAGSIAAGLFALCQGARILRVHDVAGTVQAVRVWHALHKEGMNPSMVEASA